MTERCGAQRRLRQDGWYVDHIREAIIISTIPRNHKNMREALVGHLESMREHGEALPDLDNSSVAVIELDTAR